MSNVFCQFRRPCEISVDPPLLAKLVKISEFFLIMIFWIGRDPPARLSEKKVKKYQFFILMSPLILIHSLNVEKFYLTPVITKGEQWTICITIYDASSVRKLSTFFTNCTLSFTNHICLLGEGAEKIKVKKTNKC